MAVSWALHGAMALQNHGDLLAYNQCARPPSIMACDGCCGNPKGTSSHCAQMRANDHIPGFRAVNGWLRCAAPCTPMVPSYATSSCAGSCVSFHRSGAAAAWWCSIAAASWPVRKTAVLLVIAGSALTPCCVYQDQAARPGTVP